MVAIGAGTAWGLPVDQSAEGVDDDARVILAVSSKAIEGDQRSPCAVRVIVGSEQVPLSHGDTVTVKVMEDDPLRDDELFSVLIEVAPLEVGARGLDRVIDCSTAFGDDGGDSVELYATAEVDKDDCGFGCRWDRPQTEVLTVQIVGDDTAEELDDQSPGATEISEGDLGGRIARDQDWYVFRATGGVRTRVDLLHRPQGGELVAWVQGDAGVVENRLTPTHEGDRLEVDLSEGIWFLVVAPLLPEDPTFYDLRLTALAPEPECSPGDTDVRPCGACGTAERICGPDGRWPPLLEGECRDQGECRPGETLQATCDQCGRRQDVCGEDCAWRPGVCAGAGDCTPGVWQSEECEVGAVRSRVCRDSCGWSAFGPCRTAEDGGACVPAGETDPTACSDGVDNDCDGAVDADDLDCASDRAGGWRLGLSDPCTATADCDPDPAKGLECITEADHPMFEGGYCAQVGCVFPDRCADAGGVCGVAFGQVWCLRPCVIQSDCLLGHHCATLGESDLDAAPLKACVPVCRGHADCRGGPKTFCSPRSGRCELPPDQLPGTAAPSAKASEGSGCASTHGGLTADARTGRWRRLLRR